MKREFTNDVPVISEELDDSLFEGIHHLHLQSERNVEHADRNHLLAEEALRIAGSLNLYNFKTPS